MPNNEPVRPTRKKVAYLVFDDVCQERDYIGHGGPALQIPIDSETTNEELVAGMYLCLDRQPDLVDDMEGLRAAIDELRDHNRASGTMHLQACPDLSERNIMLKILKKRQMYAFFEIEEVEEEAGAEAEPRKAPEDEVEIPAGKSAEELMDLADSWSGIPPKGKGESN